MLPAAFIFAALITSSSSFAHANQEEGANGMFQQLKITSSVKAKKVSFNLGDDYASCPCLDDFVSLIPERPADYDAATQPDPFSWNHNDKNTACNFKYKNIKANLIITDDGRCLVESNYNSGCDNSMSTISDKKMLNDDAKEQCLEYIKNEC